MSDDVQFNETKIIANPVSGNTSRFESNLVKLITKLSGGLIKNESQARHAIVVLVLAVFILSAYLLFGASGSSSVPSDLNFFPAE